MSGLEPLAALGLACNVIQLIESAGKTVSICKSIFQTGSLDPSLGRSTAHLTTAFDQLNQSLTAAPGPKNPDEAALLEVARDCSAAALNLKTEVAKISDEASKGKYSSAIRGALKTMVRKSKIEKLEKSLAAHQKALETHLLVRIYKPNEAILGELLKSTANIDSKLSGFIQALSQGHTRMEQLLAQESADIKGVVVAEVAQLNADINAKVDAEAGKTRTEISARIDGLAAEQQDMARSQRLLQSIKFSTMNQRFNQIVESDKDTCGWILDEGAVPTYNQDLKPGCGFTLFLQSPAEKLFWISGKAGSGKSTVVKFLITSDRAQSVIQEAVPNARILSHFIWAAGADPMQCSIRGILCALLYQALDGDVELAKSACDEFATLRLESKESLGDWSNKELEAVLAFVLRSSSRPTCIFLDGLDEIDPNDGQFELLKLVNRLCSYLGPRGKMCVASRPEVVLRRHLAKYSMLRVQDLTDSAIRKYATEKLKEYLPDSTPGIESQEIIHSLCSKADGVFLWVSLAIKSIGRGVLSGDNADELRRRLGALPRDLQDLYQQMWLRLNEDEQIYREDAAFFLNCALDSSFGPRTGNRKSSRPSGRWEETTKMAAVGSLSIIHVTLTFHSQLADSILSGDPSVSSENLVAKCQDMTTRLDTRCAGLLEVSPTTGVIAFIHRSATEFLMNTPEGQVILEQDRRNPQDRLFNSMKADIATLRWLLAQGHSARGDWTSSDDSFPRAPSPPNYPPSFQDSDTELINTLPWDLPGDVSSAAADYLDYIHRLLHLSAISVERAIELGFLCSAVYDMGNWPSSFSVRGPPELLQVGSWVGFTEFNSLALERLKKNSPTGAISKGYVGQLLASAFKWGPWNKAHHPHNWFDRIKWLLEEEWDLSVVLMVAHEETIGGHVELVVPTTPFLAFSDAMLGSLGFIDPCFPRCMVEFMKRGVNPSDSVVVILFESDQHFALRLQWYWAWEGLGNYIPEMDYMVVFRANLAYLIDVFSRTLTDADQELEAYMKDMAPPSATILAFRLLGENHRRQALPLPDDIPHTKFTAPRKQDDIDEFARLLRGLTFVPTGARIRGFYSSPAYSMLPHSIPGLGNFLSSPELAERSQTITFSELEQDLVSEGLLMRKADFDMAPLAPF
ncbi:hypothetical protein QBC47DRAFT_55117 [Echria macrotheca]|uniref:NACHT domain-containing protein n=1 Tax=Echria macrotheca TaxID=438768 RepID=A0AAJ0F7F5_9PEZI|nr:hypothetical protein QBC47DRAFT_55117 [Echria macrotheca]